MSQTALPRPPQPASAQQGWWHQPNARCSTSWFFNVEICLVASIVLNEVGEEEFEKLSDLPEWSVFDLSDLLFDKFLLFFKLEAEMRPTAVNKDGAETEQGLGKVTALAEKEGKSGEGVKAKTLRVEEQSECKEREDLADTSAERAEVKCNAEQVEVEKFSFPLLK